MNNNMNIYRRFLLTFFAIFVTHFSFSQSEPRGPEGPQGSMYNYVSEDLYTSINTVTQTSTTYFDGLGRELEQVLEHGGNKEIITLTDYDSYGRVTKKYLPYPASSTGSYYPNSREAQKAYYQSNYNSIYGYSQVVYDNTVNSNVIEESSPGDSWKIGGGHTQRSQVTKNTSNDKLKIYVIIDDTIVQYKRDYDDFSGRLIKKESIDPQGDKVYQYYDIKEKLIADEVRTASGSMYTYYLYDDFGQLRYVIPPLADATFKLADRKNLHELKKLCFYTEYDERHRPYKSYVPGGGCTINLYDKKDRLVFTQSETMRSKGQWLFTKYDALNRPVITGLCTGTEAQHKAALEAQTIFAETKDTFAHGYSNQAYPTAVTGNDYLTVTYYDNYDWQGEIEGGLSVSAWPDGEFPQPKNEKVAGYVTGMKQKVMGIAENKWLLSANYYDDKYREIQTVSQLYPSGREIVYRTYDFIGNLTRVREQQTIGAKMEGFDKYLSYDMLGRLSEVKQKMLGYISTDLVSIAKYTYNDLGQVTEKTNHNGIDTTRFLYDINGKQIGSTSPLFSYKLFFDQKPANMTNALTPRYDGNACFLEWTNGNTTSGYGYGYDAHKQLQDAAYMSVENGLFVSKAGYNEKGITYDLNGNIETLRRTNSGGDDLHAITNTYTGNQLSQTRINGSSYNYTYDGNGNMIYDGYKGVTILYNNLDLPEKIVAGTEEVSYIYSATGQKLATKAGSSTTYYRGSFVYNNDELDHLLHPEGIIRKTTGAYVYYYAKQDHLGSTRVLCHEANGVMKADQVTDYYPFGLTHHSNATNVNRYLFSGKELQDQTVNGKSLMLYDFGARNYDPMLGRWFNIDPALQFTNPYTYCANNPICYVDPTGMIVDELFMKQWEKQQLAIEKRIDRLQMKMDGAKDIKKVQFGERISSLQSTIGTMRQLEASTQSYGLGKVGADELGGLSYNNETGIISINYDGTANFVHEVTHAGQFESGDIAFRLTGESLGQDVYDEIAAYQAQYAYDPASVSLLPSSSSVNSSADITAGWVQGIVHNGKPIYTPTGSARTGLYPININSTQAELKKAYPNASFWGSDTKLFKNMYKMHYKK